MKKQLFVIELLACCLLAISCTRQTTTFIDVSDKSSSAYSDLISSDDVTAFVMDKSSMIWIGTSYGLNLYDGYQYYQFFHNSSDTLSISGNEINCLFRDSHDCIWVGTSNGLSQYIGLGRFVTIRLLGKEIYNVKGIAETTDGRILVNAGDEVCEVMDGILVPKLQHIGEEFSIETDNNGGFWLFQPMQSFYYDNQYVLKKHFSLDSWANLVISAKDKQRIWVAQNRTIYCIDMNTQEVKYCLDKSSQILPNILFPTNDGVLLKSNRHGLFSYSLKSNELVRYKDLNLDPMSDMISCFYRDMGDNLWVGFYNGSFRFISKTNETVNAINQASLYTTTQGEYITTLANDEVGVVWGGTNTDIFCYDNQSGKTLLFPQKDVFVGGPYYRQFLRKIVPVSTGQWILTNARISFATCREEKLRINHSFRGWCTLGDCVADEERCYITTDKKLLYVMHKDGEVDSIAIDHPLYNKDCKLLRLNDGKILLAMQGLNFVLLDADSGALQTLPIEGVQHGLSVLPTCLFEDKAGNVWLGSNGYGLFCLSLANNKIDTVSSLPTQYVMSILQDKNGVLWMGTRKGIMSYSPSDYTSYLYNIRVNFKRPPTSFNQQCICSLGEQIVLGGRDGCMSILPSIMLQKTVPNLDIRTIYVHSESVVRKALNPAGDDKYVFAHNQNDLEIDFGGVNFGDAPLYIYEYMMEGFDRNWIPASSDRSVFYSNLPAGDYRFRVRAMQSYGAGVIEEKSISVKVLPAPWLSIPAWILYAGLVIGLIVYINWLYLRIRSNRMALQLANADKEREQRTNQMNMSFFANISHEFRNPLTMIAGPIITLYNDASLPKVVHRRLAMVRQNINSMLKLIDQMLDFNQLENDVLRLKVGQYDAVHEINLWANVFEESTRERSIALERKGLDEPYYTWLDHDKLDKILSNLFTNALKHTPDNGVIRVVFSVISAQQAETDFGCTHIVASDYLCIGVFNNGKHIPEEKLNEVFKRYYQIEELNENHQHGWGTGIGLYYVQRLVQLHHGNIRVENVQDGGVQFLFVIPSGEEAYRENEHIDSEQLAYNVGTATLKDDDTIVEAQRQNEENRLAQKPKILIVDDDTRLARYLRSLFCDDYQVENKYSAEAALAEMERIAPDIILSDVIMGEMSGYDFCRTMKNDVAYSHIPFILITAKSQINEQIEGLDLGANAYVTKPFDPEYLKALVRSQLKNCENIRKQLNENVQIEPVEGELSAQDRAFMEELYQLMEKHLADLDLNLNTMCEELRMSRSKFNYKIKGLTGDTPNNFFKNYKLNRAARLLKEGKNNVSEVAMLTGFGTVSYFSVCFKKQFGVNPSDYQ